MVLTSLFKLGYHVETSVNESRTLRGNNLADFILPSTKFILNNLIISENEPSFHR